MSVTFSALRSIETSWLNFELAHMSMDDARMIAGACKDISGVYVSDYAEPAMFDTPGATVLERLGDRINQLSAEAQAVIRQSAEHGLSIYMTEIYDQALPMAIRLSSKPADDVSLNVANGNAAAILNILGIDSEELCGSISHQDLLTKLEDNAIYAALQGYAPRLHDVAMYAQSKNLEISFC